jgi:hypothetical protein
MYHWQFASGHEKSASWYVAALVVVLFFVVNGIITGAYLMSVAAFLFAGVYIMIENNSTPLTDVHVTENGIQVESTFYPYGDLVSFALVYEEQIPRLLRLSLRKGISTTIDIPLFAVFWVDISKRVTRPSSRRQTE